MSSTREPTKIPEIFRNLDGSQWHVFVEAAGITGRPGIIRNLQKAGAVICSDPRKAQVILVDSNSAEGRLFILDWGSDPNKVVLNYPWVQASIAASKVLGQEDQWGGHLTVNDGLPVSMLDQGESPPNSLPTPRITPVEVAATEPISPSQQPTSSDTATEALQPVQLMQSMSRHSSDAQSTLTSDVFQHLPPETMATLAQAMMQRYPPPGLNSGLPPVTGIGGTPQPMLNFNQPFFPLLSQGMGSWNISPVQNFGFPLFNPQMMNWSNPSQSKQLPPHGGMFVTEAYPLANRSIDVSGSSASGAHPENSAFSPSTNVNDRETMSTFPIRRSPATQSQTVPHSTPPSSSSTLFTSQEGKDLAFFVQVDLKNRSKVVSAIKKHGGIISSSNTNADYAILYSRSKTFSLLLKSTLAAGTPAISANFVHDCIGQEKVLETSAYEFETPKGASRSKRKLAEIEDADVSKNSKRLENSFRADSKSSPLLRNKKSSASDAASSQYSQSFSGQTSNAHSPTPPPPHTRLPRPSGGGFMYTDHERDYCMRYVKTLLGRDHDIPTTAIAKALYAKMDYHSLGSWKTFLTQNFATELETMRKKAGIAYRTAQNARAREAQREVLDDQLRREIDTVAHFFATGGGKQTNDNDEEEDENDIWARLNAQTECYTAENWEAFYAAHYEEVKKRYTELTETLETTIT